MSAELLAKKRRIRGGHRVSASRMIQQVNETIATRGVDSADNKRLLQLKFNLEEKLSTLKQLDEQILEMVEEEGVADEIEQADNFKERIYAAIIDIEGCCSNGSPPSGSSTRAAASAAPAVPFSPHSTRVKLPKLAIRPFDGNITKWTTFWDSFESAIDSSPGLSDIDKFNYLRSLLEKSAAEAIAGLTLTADNYKEAVSILKKRFGNKCQIISKHMDTLLNIDAVASANNLKGLRHLNDVVETQVRGLRSLGVESSSYGGLLSSVLIRKIPPELQLVLSREVGDGNWELDHLLKRL